MGRISAGVLALLSALGVAGCGTSAYPSTLRVVVEDPAGLFGGEAIAISVFDASSGDTRDWALKTLGQTTAGNPIEATVSSVETRIGTGGSPAREVRAGIYLPDYRRFGWYELKLQPKEGAELQVNARFIAWDNYSAFGVLPLPVRVTATADGKAWKLDVTVTLGTERPVEDEAVPVTDPLTLDLVKAAAAGNLPEVERLLLKGGQINGADAEGRTPLIAAAYESRREVVLHLVQRGADVNLKDRAGVSAFLAAASNAGSDSVQVAVIMNAGANIHATDGEGNTALIRAARQGNADTVQRLLVFGAEPDTRNTAGLTALQEAAAGGCEPGHVETVRHLIRGSANPGLALDGTRPPLDLAREAGCAEIVSILEATGAR